MTDTTRDSAQYDEDRLPWLEPVEGVDDEQVSWGKMAGFILAALLALGLVIGGVYLLRQSTVPPAKDPKLIAAQEGDYKVPPTDPGGMKVEGKGDSAFAASEGAEANGKINLNALPEAPVKGTKDTKEPAAAQVAAKPAPAPAPAKTAKVELPKTGAPLVAKPPVTAPAKVAAGGKMIQLGAYGSASKAEQAWTMLSKKYSYLAALTKSVEQAQVGGSTVYRLRAAAGDQAGSVCAKLKAAGANCLPVS